MKKVIGMIVAAVVLISASAVFAQCGGCPSQAKAKSDKPCCVALEKVKLTDAQQAKVAALQSECKGISCPVATQKKMAKELKTILDKKQYKQWEQACADAKKSGGTCPSK
ncbi:MAG: hypothetical protein FJ395_05420 [Verrucomicrobia bacterium]|nr:hypothetical protein [Verrucomicrobiota bacterium]